MTICAERIVVQGPGAENYDERVRRAGKYAWLLPIGAAVLHLLRATFTPFTAAAPPPSKLLITPSIYEFSFHAPTDLRSSRAVPGNFARLREEE